MDIRKTRTCQKCKTVVPLEKVRLFPKDKENNLLVCEVCCEELKKSAKIVKGEITKPGRTSSLPPAEYSSYHCSRCAYSFRVDTMKIGVLSNLYCPYCGKADRLTEQKKAVPLKTLKK